MNRPPPLNLKPRNSRSVSMVTPPSRQAKQHLILDKSERLSSPKMVRSQSDSSLLGVSQSPVLTKSSLIMANHQKVSFTEEIKLIDTGKPCYESTKGLIDPQKQVTGILRCKVVEEKPFIHVQPRVSMATGILCANTDMQSRPIRRDRRVSLGDNVSFRRFSLNGRSESRMYVNNS